MILNNYLGCLGHWVWVSTTATTSISTNATVYTKTTSSFDFRTKVNTLRSLIGIPDPEHRRGVGDYWIGRALHFLKVDYRAGNGNGNGNSLAPHSFTQFFSGCCYSRKTHFCITRTVEFTPSRVALSPNLLVFPFLSNELIILCLCLRLRVIFQRKSDHPHKSYHSIQSTVAQSSRFERLYIY